MFSRKFQFGKLRPIVVTRKAEKTKVSRTGKKTKKRTVDSVEIPALVVLLIIVFLMTLIPESALALNELLKSVGFSISDLRGSTH